MAGLDAFKHEYEKLNKAQKEAVDIIEGPVMVVAGPGTGKTQILAIRIGNILLKTGTEADSILCLTFTNSGAKAMAERLARYTGNVKNGVVISTFHSFARHYLIEKYYYLLGFDIEPEIISDEESVFLVDEILHDNNWEHLRPRADPEKYFSELKQLISILKRERLTPEEFDQSIREDIENLKNDPENLSSKGERKGSLKKEVDKKIESLERTSEVVEFYRLFELKKLEMNRMDFDDILENAVKLVENYENVRADIYENFHYILVDEHQDSSGVQNNFLKAIWGTFENPNIFVVGDDRQLIYAFSGASFSYFKEFSYIFGKTRLITLTENYRSNKFILALADDLLSSSLSTGKLKSNINSPLKKGSSISLNEYSYPRDEIIGAGLFFKEKIKEGLNPEECAILLPRNVQVRNAIEILRNMGLPVSSGKNISLFDTAGAQSFLRILGIIADPYDSILLSESILDKSSGIETLSAHKFLKNTKPGKLSIDELRSFDQGSPTLFGASSISAWGNTLANFVNSQKDKTILEIISQVGNDIFLSESKHHEELILNVEVVRSFLHTAILFTKKNKNAGLGQFIKYLRRLESYGSHVPLATFDSKSGIQVMTLYKSKGLEYQAVWIAHMNEEVLMSEKRSAFALPEKVKMHIAERDILTAKRELYVAITRAKEYCSISYAEVDYKGEGLELAQIIRDLPDAHFMKKNSSETEREILSAGPETYLPRFDREENDPKDLKNFVKENYADLKISVTMLNNFFECPWKWYFRNFLRLPEIKTKSLALGSAVHKAIEFILKRKLKDNSLPALGEIENVIKNELQMEGLNSSFEMKKLLKSGIESIERYVDDFYPDLAANFSPERALQFTDSTFPHLRIYGKIDLTETLPNGDIIITDFKTGKSKTKSVIEKLDDENRLSPHLRQLAMYSYLVRGAEKGKSVSESRLLYLESLKSDKNALYSTQVSNREMDLLIRDIKDYDNLLKSGEWVERPCNYDSYGRNTGCEYCKMAEIYKTV